MGGQILQSIDQEDPVHVAKQVDQMDKIYHGADLTIVAVLGDTDNDSGLAWVNESWYHSRKAEQVAKDGKVISTINACRPWRTITETSKWSSRGWTYQESFFHAVG